MDEFYVYILLDPRKSGSYLYKEIDISLKYEPFYVGKGKGKRMNGHSKNDSYNPRKSQIIELIENSGFNYKSYILIIANNLNEIDAFDLERKIIKTIGRIDLNTGILTNLTDGGEGLSGAISRLKGRTYEEIHGENKAKQLKDERSERFKGDKNPMYGKPSIWKGKNITESMKATISKAQSKPVYQIDKITNVIINEYPSAVAAAKALNVKVNSIHNCLSEKDKTKTAHGFKWKYKEGYNYKPRN